MIDLSKDTWQKEVAESTGPVLVDFYTKTCGPCKRMAPVLERLSTGRQDVKFCKLELEDGPELFEGHGVTAVPTFIIFSGGKPLSKQSGLQSEKQITDWINEKVSASAK